MLDFVMITTELKRSGRIEVYPKFITKKSKDLMIKGHDFYAIWDERNGRWSTDPDDATDLIDQCVKDYISEHYPDTTHISPKWMWDGDSGIKDKWLKYTQKQTSDNFKQLNQTIIFQDTPVKKENYASIRLPYKLEDAETPVWDELVGTLYLPEERHKIEWIIGSIVSGDSKKIQKFLVFNGEAGAGKSTIINIIQMLFQGYWATFSAKALGSAAENFALEPFKNNPLVAIEHDADLSRIEDNTRLNSIVSHETMNINEKFKSLYSNKFNSMLIIGTNRNVRITDAKSGLTRRLIDVYPSNRKIPKRRYDKLMKSIEFELGAIAKHCLDVYLDDKNYYDDYLPINMMSSTNDFFNFVEEHADLFAEQDYTTLNQAWSLYLEYVSESKIQYPMPKRVLKSELKVYFNSYKERGRVDGSMVYNLYSEFRPDKIGRLDLVKEREVSADAESTWLAFESQSSIFDEVGKDWPAQYANSAEKPYRAWENVTTTLSDISTAALHYVRMPLNYICIDFDIPGEDGRKSLAKNLEAASHFPPTYAELSKSGQGIHLIYIYDGDPTELSSIYDVNVEVKVFNGKSSLRRMLTKCVNYPIAHISSGLPLKKEVKKKVMTDAHVKTERGLRQLILRNLRKEIHANTKPSIDFIKKILDDAAESGLKYDISDMKPGIICFANDSTHNAKYCLEVVDQMIFSTVSDEATELIAPDSLEKPIAIFDVEVFINFFGLAYTVIGEPEEKVQILYNPSGNEIEELFKKYRMIGFNNRNYDNHICYGRTMGMNNLGLYELSQGIINGGNSKFKKFGPAYNWSYADIYDYLAAARKMSLKKWEIKLGIHHHELGLPWDKPVPEELWPEVMEYCADDVRATRAVFDATYSDFLARECLVKLANIFAPNTKSVMNDTTNTLTGRIIFGDDKEPQSEFVYTNLTTGEQYKYGWTPYKDENAKYPNAFPGYSYEGGKNLYNGEDIGRGGRVFARPGMYAKTVTFDVASMHPHSIIALNLFGKYTERFAKLVKLRIFIKRQDFDGAKELFPELVDILSELTADTAKAMAEALKTAINSVYGLTSAGFDNKFRDRRNTNNIVALRGALFISLLKDEVEARGGTVIHIKTDSIKVLNPSSELSQFIFDFAKKWGYEFEIESQYSKICLVNDAVYIAKDLDPNAEEQWHATGAQFQHPYVYKTLFTKEPIEFKDMCETKSVTSALYLDMNEGQDEDSHNYVFVGRVGSFCPIKPGCGGGLLMRQNDDKYAAATGTKGYRWLEAETVKDTHKENDIDQGYFATLVDKARENISKYGDIDWFINGTTYDDEYPLADDELPF